MLLADQTDLWFRLRPASHSARRLHPRPMVDLPDEPPNYTFDRDLNVRELLACQALVHNERPIRVKCRSTLALYSSASRSNSRTGRT